ncbi:MAG: ATP-dependent protease subunit HslV [Thermomicrobiales bacterium]|nr:ATP-dependent protease subunit HslV [Thermomicrobiales bacterium]
MLEPAGQPLEIPVTTSDISGNPRRIRSTTILGVRRNGAVALAGDGQVTIGDVVLKHGARKIRTLYDGQVLAGFAGAVADALTLFARFESELKNWDGNLRRAAVELTKEWRSDRYLRRLEAQLIVADPDSLLVLSGEGDVIEPDDGIVAIGSGAPYATAAAKALLVHTDLGARAIALASMEIAANLCIFTNDRFAIESIEREGAGGEDASAVELMPLDGYQPPTDDGDSGDTEDEEAALDDMHWPDDDEEGS